MLINTCLIWYSSQEISEVAVGNSFNFGKHNLQVMTVGNRLALHELEKPFQRGERIADFMRDPCRQLAKGGELVRVAQQLLGMAPFYNVAGDDHCIFHFAICSDVERSFELEQKHAAVRVRVDVFSVQRCFFHNHLQKVTSGSLSLLRLNQDGKMPEQNMRGWQAEHGLDRGRSVCNVAVQIMRNSSEAA